MKMVLAGLVAGGLLVGVALAQEPKAAAPVAAGTFKTTREKASYGLGLSMGRNFKAQSVDLDLDLLAKGLKDGVAGAEGLLSDAEIQAALQAFQQELAAKQMAAAKVAGEKSLKEGQSFLATNAKKEGVKTLPSGLQFKVLKEGTGPSPKATDTVRTHYKGTLLDGTVFDSSYDRGQPATFGVGDVIKGWTEALQLMKVGSKWLLFIPPDLAYGASPPPGSRIPPNSTLVFEVELLNIEK